MSDVAKRFFTAPSRRADPVRATALPQARQTTEPVHGRTRDACACGHVEGHPGAWLEPTGPRGALLLYCPDCARSTP